MTEKEIFNLLRPNIQKFEPYSTARDDFKGSLGVFLDANESPYQNGWNRYPDPRQKSLKTKISEIKGIPAQQIFIGNGSDEAIDLLFRLFCRPGTDNAIAIDPSYGMYSVASQTNDIELRKVALGSDFSLPTEEILKRADVNTKLLFLCSPNNPTGNAFELEEITDIVTRFNGIVVLDEAYVDFSDRGSMLPSLNEHGNLVILQTCSKARGMASLRVGLAFASEMIIRYLNAVKYPYNISGSTQKTALEILSRNIDSQVMEIKEEREALMLRLKEYRSIQHVYHSDANFVLVRVDNADRMYDHLVKDGIIVRNRSTMTGCRNCLRITVGLKSENEKLIQSIERYEASHIC